nr:MAG TPA: Chromatin remodeling complex ATPase [Caudoviricetes sp.]
MINWGFGINVHQEGDIITITGFDGNDMAKFITKVWSTSVLEKYMFKECTWRKMSFYSFFLVDVVYMFERLVHEKRNYYVPVRTIKQILEAIKQKTWYKNVLNDNIQGRLDFKQLTQFNYKPLDHQKRFLDYYDTTPTRYNLRGALLNGTPGSGKTFISNAVMQLANVDRIIVVAPKNALNRVWYDDIVKMYKTPPKMFSTGIDASAKPDPDTKLFVYHYEALDLAIDHHRLDFSKGTYNYGLILDESHNFNDIGSQRTQKWIELCELSKSNNIIHASGTPLKALGSECIPLFRVLDPSFTKAVEERFKKIYGSSASRGLDIIKNRLGIVSFVIRKEELGLEKPIMQTLPIKIPNGNEYTLTSVREVMKKYIAERIKYYKQREDQDLAFYKACLERHEDFIGNDPSKLAKFNYYKECVARIQKIRDLQLLRDETAYCKKYEFNDISASLLKEDVKAFRSVCSVIKYLELKIQGECLGNVVGKMRIQAHVDMCRYIPFREICQSTVNKTVVFTSFVDVLTEAIGVCKEQELNPIAVWANTNHNLKGLIQQFEEDIRINPLIATYDSLSTAVPLVMADTMIMVNAPFRSHIQDQAISRIHRLSQTSQTTVYQAFLDTGEETNISSRSFDIMKWSQEQVEAMTGVKSPYSIDTNEDGNITVTTESLDESLDLSINIGSILKLDRNSTVDKVSRRLSW